MSERRGLERERMARAQALAKNVENITNQILSHPEILTGNAEDAGGIDELKTTDIPAEMLFPYIYGKMRAENDGCRAWGNICTMLERGLPAVNGKRVKIVADIAMAGSGGGGKGGKLVHQPNILARNTYRRDWREKAEEEGADISE